MADVTLSAKYADGTIFRTSGFIDIESWTSADSKLTMTMFSRNNSWAIVQGSGDMSGTPKQVAVAGVTYNVLADADFDHVVPLFKNEAVVHTGGVMRKMVRQAKSIKSITIEANMRDYEALRAIADN